MRHAARWAGPVASVLVMAFAARAEEPPAERDLVRRLFGRKVPQSVPPNPFHVSCISEEQKKRLAEVKRAETDPTAFRPTAVWLPPFFMTDAERSYFWAAFVYFHVNDFESNTRSIVFPPFVVSLCTPASETLMTPVFGQRTDAEGTARLILTYFQRRDRLAETDVLFPFVWSLRERATVDGPWDDVAGAVPPLVWWRERPNGDHFRAFAPLFFNWGTKDDDTTLVANVYRHTWKTGASLGVVPFWFSGHEAQSEYQFAPPLFWRWHSPEDEGLIAGPYYRVKEGASLRTGLVPFWVHSEESGKTVDVIPPLLFARQVEGDSETTWVLNTYFERRPNWFTLASIPFFFAGAEGREHWWTIPALLTAHAGDEHVEQTWVANAWLRTTDTGWAFNLVPVLFLEREPTSTRTFVPPLFWQWGDGQELTTVAANVYFRSTPTERHLGVVPFYLGGWGQDFVYDLVPPLLLYRSVVGDTLTFWAVNTWFRSHPGGWRLYSVPFFFGEQEGDAHWWTVPPLLTFHSGHGDVEETWVANAYSRHSPRGWTFNLVPVLFAAREGDEHHTFVPPLFWRWGDAESTTTIAGPLFERESKARVDLGFVPLYFHGADAEGSYDTSPLVFWRWNDARTHHLLLPPLLAYHEGDGATETTFAVNTFFQTRPDGFTLTSFPFLFLGREGSESHAVVPPLFWRFASPEATTTVAANVFWRTAKGRFDLGVVPFYFHGSDEESSYDTSPLLFWRWSDARTHHLLLPPLLAYHHGDGQTESTYALNTFFQTRPTGFTLVSFPFLFAGREADEGYAYVPPLFWRWGDAEATTTIAGPVFWRTAKDRVDVGFAPLYFRGQTATASYDVSPPLFWRWNEGETHHLVIPPLLTFHEGDGRTETTWAVNTYFQTRPTGFTLASFPFLFAGREDDSGYAVVPPVFWRFSDPDSTTTVAANVFWRTAKDRFDLGVAPFFFHGRDPSGGYDISPPLFWSWGDASEHHLLIPPLLAYHQGDGVTESTFAVNTFFQTRPTGFTLTSFPFLFAGRERDASYAVVPPLFWRFSDPDSTTTVAANVFWRTAKDRFDLGVAPLFFHGRDATGGYDVSPPLFWSWGDASEHHLLIPPLLAYHQGDGRTETTWAVNTWFQTRPTGFTLTSFPFLFAGRENDEDYAVVPPVYWHFADAESSTTLLGTAYLRTTRDRQDFGIAPFFFHGRGIMGAYDVSPPVFWWWTDTYSHHLVLPPLLAYHSGDDETETTFAVNTFFQTRPKGFTLTSFPFLFVGREGDAGYAVVPPLFWHFADAQSSTTVAANVYVHSKPAGWDVGVVPLYFGGREGTSGYDVVPPLFWRFKDEERETLIAGPYFRRDDRQGAVFGLAPFYFGGRSATGSWDLLAPLFFRSSDAQGSHVAVFPLFDYRQTATSHLFVSPLAVQSVDEEHERTVVAGLYWRFSGPDADTRVVFPFWWDFVSKESKSRLSTAFPLYWRYEKPDEVTNVLLNVMWSSGMSSLGPSWSLHVFPFFDLASYHPGHFLWQVLAGVLGREVQGDLERWRLGWIWTEPHKAAPAKPVAGEHAHKGGDGPTTEERHLLG